MLALIPGFATLSAAAPLVKPHKARSNCSRDRAVARELARLKAESWLQSDRHRRHSTNGKTTTADSRV